MHYNRKVSNHDHCSGVSGGKRDDNSKEVEEYELNFKMISYICIFNNIFVASLSVCYCFFFNNALYSILLF